MYKRLKNARVIFFFYLLLISVFSIHAEIHDGEMNAPSDLIVGKTERLKPTYNEGIGPMKLFTKGLFIFYQQIVGPTKGTNCPMIPSCSEYAKLAVAKNGLFEGIIMTADRLHRCGHDLHLYTRLWSYSRGWCYYDPL